MDQTQHFDGLLDCCIVIFLVARGQKGHLLILNATGFVDVLWVFKDGLDKLTKHALHEALAARKHFLQEGNVSTVGRQQQSHVREVLDCFQRECCEGDGRELPLKTRMRNLENPGGERVASSSDCIPLHWTHCDEERRGHLQH